MSDVNRTDETDDDAPRDVYELERGITRCYECGGYYAYIAGPCFTWIDDARDYRDELDEAGVTWWPPV
jgi:hypothetical protein